MDLSLEELINKLKLLEVELNKEIPNILDIIAHDGVALMNKRLEEKGVEGAEYSPEYRDFKLKKQGSDAVRVVNLRFSNQMLNNLQVIDRSVVGGTEFHAGVGNTTDENVDKMEANVKRYNNGKFLEMTKEEEAILNKTATELFDQVIKRIFP